MQRQRPGFATRSARPLVLWCLMLVLPVYGWSATLAELLGALHSHTPPAALVAAADPLAGWQDFRRVVHGAREMTAGPAHRHDGAARHHHAGDDASVVALEPANGADAADAQPPGGAAVVFAFDAWGHCLAAEPGGQRWPAACEPIRRGLATGRLERPPNA